MRAARTVFVFACVLLLALTAVASAKKHKTGANHKSEGNVGASSKPILRFNKDGVFKIMQFTDLHFGMHNNQKQDQQTLEITRGLLAAEPDVDLVVLTGDSIMNTGGNCTDSFFYENWGLVTQALNEAGIPWAWVSGNHDDEYCSIWKRAQIAEYDYSFPHSLTRGVDALTGVNYVLPILEHDAKVGSKPAANVWMFDSGAYQCLNVPGYGCVAPDVVTWYRATVTAQKAQYSQTIPALAFMHIPLPEYDDMWNYFNVTGSFWTDTGGCSSVNSGLFSAFLEQGDVKMVTVGHDHDCDYAGNFFGVTLAYGRKTGYGCYGPPTGFLSGARVFSITQSPFKIDSWMRLDDGSLHVPTDVHVPSASDYVAQCEPYTPISVGGKEEL